MQKDPNGCIAKIIMKNQKLLTNTSIINSIKDYLIFKRNKAIFLNIIA